ncbi:hypothetical protein P9726_04525 [Geobacillus stearothermophilus]|uniref:hypothetical protein n=1 Tax=Geobacillus stearothermophilus TaxID=1422 RepID=UPI002E23FD70|nr:hypothetical protein [Geobacillus stearothermophilus]
MKETTSEILGFTGFFVLVYFSISPQIGALPLFWVSPVLLRHYPARAENAVVA